MSAPQFFKMRRDLRALGVSRSLVELYGALTYHVGDNGECWPTHETLAREIGLTNKHSRRWVNMLLNQLRDLKLLAWKRTGPHANRYQVLEPDLKWIGHYMQGQKMRTKLPIKDANKTSHRKESSSEEPDTTEARSVKPGSVARRKPNAKSSRVDDEQGDSAEQRFARRLRVRHGPACDPALCIANVKRVLEQGNIEFPDFAAYDKTHTTGRRFTNVNGYYVHLAQALVKEARLAVRNGTHTAAPPVEPEPPRNAQGRCANCNGSGILADGAFCDACTLGRELGRLSRRASKPALSKLRARGHTA